MYDLKVAVATFHNGWSVNDIGGASSGPVYLVDQLRRQIETVDFIALRNTKDQSPIAAGAKYCADPSVLAEYDFVIFTGPGLTYEKYNEITPNRYLDVLQYAKKFTFICNEENDAKLYPYHMNFLTHPSLAFITFNCPGMVETFKDDYLQVCPDWEYINFAPVMPEKDIIMEKAKQKNNKIMSTCRWTTSKRVYEYLAMSPEFIKNGIEVFAAGSHQSYWYNLKMEELPKDTYTDLGFFEPSQLPELLKDVKYHWNFLFQLRSMGRLTHRPRVEIATMEAFREGCLPVICKEFTPDWLGEDSAVRLSKHDYLSIPEVLGSMRDSERLERMSLLYDLVDSAMCQYAYYAHRIAEICGKFDHLK